MRQWPLAIFDGLRFRGVPRLTLAFGLFSAVCVLLVGTHFFASLKWQLFLAEARAGFSSQETPWSAPLDDVFIHFDFARATARGYPFEWSEGNGYSSGGTSLLYPFILALGYRIGYGGLSLMLWAGISACICVWATLLAGKRLFRGLPQVTSFLLPPIFLSVGALNWSLFSGMEVALFLAIWGGCVVAWYSTIARPRLRSYVWFGLCNAALVACRPESAVVVAVLCLSALGYSFEKCSWKGRAQLLAVTALPGALVIAGHAIANKVFTGDWSAAGALVKLELNHPYMTGEQIWDAWKFHVEYQIMRVTDYHFSDLRVPMFGVQVGVGWVVWLLALAPLAFRATRREGILLWLCMSAWVMVVALNGQVRWQNERYTMPAVAWLLIAAALGVGAILHRAARGVQALREQSARDAARGPEATHASISPLKFGGWALLGSMGLVLMLVFAFFQEPRYRGQLWFFGRASRNIYEQHIAAARAIKQSRTARVLVGDAGAIPYVADIPALDIIGLGGYHDYPFARATRLGVAAGLELIERMPPTARPDLLAIYPSWWGSMPAWFGNKLTEFYVRGNVICGGASKVLYRPNWEPFDFSKTPFEPARNLHLVGEMDVADLVSEKELGFRLHGAPGYVSMKLLPHPKLKNTDAWDAGRLLPQGSRAEFTLDGFRPQRDATLLLRFAPATRSELKLIVGNVATTIRLWPKDEWLEFPVELPAAVVRERIHVTLEAVQGETVLFHAWGLQQK